MTKSTSNMSTFERLSTGQKFHLPVPKDMRIIRYSKFDVLFLDHTGNPIGTRLGCTYRTDELYQVTEELKTIYKQVLVLDEIKGVAQIQVKLAEGENVQDSFDKFRKPRR